MDSVYMRDIMAQIGKFEWGINMDNDTSVDCTGANTKPTTNMMEKENQELHLWQHNNLPLVFSTWSDNNVVKSLYNFHPPVIIPDWVQGQIKTNKVRQPNPVGIPIPLQQKEYSEMLYLIDKGNSTKVKYVIGKHMYVYN